LVDNVPRVLPGGVDARFDLLSWTVPALFRVLRREGGVEEREMFRAFNMGIGMVAVVAADRADAVVAELREAGETAWIAGEIVPGDGKVVLA
jgi:phosphoribosylformylglycinamidine cyclo-ligase